MVSATAWGIAIFIAAVYLASLYNQYVTLKHNVTKAWSNVDVLLKQRNEELQRLIAVCKPYMQYEQAVFQEIARARALETTARAAASPKQIGSTETELRRSTAKLLALVERYPELSAIRSSRPATPSLMSRTELPRSNRALQIAARSITTPSN
jgi:LemA protein